MLNSLVAQLGLVLVAAISAIGAGYAVYASRDKTEAEADKTDRESEQIGDQTWISRLNALAKDFDRLQDLSDERFQRLVEIEMLITEHVGWDHEVIRELRKHNINVSDPPSLVYVRRKLKEAQDKEIAAHGPDPTATN